MKSNNPPLLRRAEGYSFPNTYAHGKNLTFGRHEVHGSYGKCSNVPRHTYTHEILPSEEAYIDLQYISVIPWFRTALLKAVDPGGELLNLRSVIIVIPTAGQRGDMSDSGGGNWQLVQARESGIGPQRRNSISK